MKNVLEKTSEIFGTALGLGMTIFFVVAIVIGILSAIKESGPYENQYTTSITEGNSQ